MPSAAIILAFFVSGTFFLAIRGQGTENHQQQHHDSHGSEPDPNRPYMTLWRKRGNNAVNYQYNMHKPMKNGQVNQHGSVIVYKPPHKKNQPDRSGFMVSYSMSQDFDSNKPLQHKQNNMKDTSNRSPQGSSHEQYPRHQAAPYPPAHSHPQHHYRNDGPANDHHCYDTVNSGEVFCCSLSYNGGHERCWKQNPRWE